MEIIDFQAHILRKNGIAYKRLLGYNPGQSDLNLKELQALLEIQQLIYVMESYKDFLERADAFFERKLLIKNPTYLLLKDIIREESLVYDLRLNAERTANQFLLLTLIQVFNDKFLLWYEADEASPWYNSYDVIDNTTKIIDKFLIFFKRADFAILQENGRFGRELVLYLISCGLVHNFLKKKTERPKNSKKVLADPLKKLEVGGPAAFDEGRRKSTVKKSVFYAFNPNFCMDVHKIFFNLKIYFYEPDIIDIGTNKFMAGFHYLSVTKVFRENSRSNRIFVLKNSQLLEKIRKIQYYLDFNFYVKIKKELLKKYNLDSEKYFEQTLESYLKSKNLIFFASQQKKNSEYFLLLVFFYLERFAPVFDYPFFLTYFFDFRGRLYSDSLVSPMGNKIFRFLYNYGTYTTADLEIIKLEDVELAALHLIYEKSGLLEYFPETKANLIFKKIAVVVFFELGKIIKSQMLEKCGGRLQFLTFVGGGAEVFEKFYKKECLDPLPGFETQLEIFYLFYILENFYKKNYIKHIIYKDATASAIQLLMVLLETTNERNLKICNLLDDGYWYDTYYYIIEDFKKKHLISSFSQPFFTRKNLKKTIMTYNYSATFKTCFVDFMTTAGLKNLADADYKNLYADFSNFYKFLRDNFESRDFFKNSPKTLTTFLLEELSRSNQIRVVTSDLSEAYLEYKKMIDERLERRLGSVRITSLFSKPSGDLDLRKISQSLRPNIVHSVDACYVRLIIIYLPQAIITIHDSFAIDILNVHILINAANFAINHLVTNQQADGLHYRFSSKFILL